MKLFVGNLPYDATDTSLRELFEAYGAVVSTKIIIDRDTGRSRGFGFVEMENDDEAREAMGQLDGSNFNGRNIAVNEAEERKPRDSSPSRRGPSNRNSGDYEKRGPRRY